MNQINYKMISIVVSVYNEEEVLRTFHENLEGTIVENGLDAEIVYVNDGSRDNSIHILRELKSKSPNLVRVINFSKNFGHEAAMIAGIDYSRGKAVVCMDSDLQHPPSLIPSLVKKFEEGFDIVNMVREKREDNGWLKNKLSGLFYRFINKLSDQKLQENASDFFLISERVVDVLRNNFRERNRFLRGFIQIIGFNKTTESFIAPKRPAGESKYSFLRLISLSVNAIISFSKFPLYLGIYFGLLFVVFSLVLSVYTLYVYFFGNTPPSGYTTLVLFMSISFSILFILIGIIGVYVGYNFDESKKRPIYLIDSVI